MYKNYIFLPLFNLFKPLAFLLYSIDEYIILIMYSKFMLNNYYLKPKLTCYTNICFDLHICIIALQRTYKQNKANQPPMSIWKSEHHDRL